MAEKKGAEKKKKTFKRYQLYAVSGDKLERKNKSCPKCGDDSFLAAHKDRLACGKCGYVEKVSKEKPAEKKEEKPEKKEEESKPEKPAEKKEAPE